MNNDVSSNRIRELERRIAVLERKGIPNNYGAVLADHMSLPLLRGFWPMCSYGTASDVFDFSMQGRTVAFSASPSLGLVNNVVTYASLSGGTYLSRADDAGLSITGILTVGGWFYVTSLASAQNFIAKWLAGTNNRSYVLQVLTGGVIRVVLSNNGTAFTIFDTTAVITVNTWYHIVATYTPSNNVTIYINGVPTILTTSVPASIFDSTATFRLGAYDDAGFTLGGRIALPFVCANAIGNARIVSLYQNSLPFFQ